MSCKCGATVKAKRERGRNHPIWAFRALGDAGLRNTRPMRPEPAGGGSGVSLEGRPAQEFGTIEGRSKEVTTLRGGECRSPARWNSIRCSTDVERMMGKRVKTFSRRA